MKKIVNAGEPFYAPVFPGFNQIECRQWAYRQIYNSLFIISIVCEFSSFSKSAALFSLTAVTMLYMNNDMLDDVIRELQGPRSVKDIQEKCGTRLELDPKRFYLFVSSIPIQRLKEQGVCDMAVWGIRNFLEVSVNEVSNSDYKKGLSYIHTLKDETVISLWKRVLDPFIFDLDSSPDLSTKDIKEAIFKTISPYLKRKKPVHISLYSYPECPIPFPQQSSSLDLSFDIFLRKGSVFKGGTCLDLDDFWRDCFVDIPVGLRKSENAKTHSQDVLVINLGSYTFNNSEIKRVQALIEKSNSKVCLLLGKDQERKRIVEGSRFSRNKNLEIKKGGSVIFLDAVKSGIKDRKKKKKK